MKEGAARYILGKDTKKLNTIYTTGRIRHSEKRRVRSGKIRIRTTGSGAAKAESGQIGQFPGTGGGQLHRRWMAGAETQSETGQREEAALRRRIQPIGQPEVDKSVNKNRSLPHAGGRSGRSLPADGAAREIGTLKVAAHKIETRRIAAHKIRGRRAAAPKIGIRRAAFREIGVRRAAAREIGVRRAAAPGLRVEIPNDNAGRG